MASNEEMQNMVEFIFKQYVFHAILFIVNAANKQLFPKDDIPIFTLVEELSNEVKAPFKSWYEGMLARSYHDLKVAWKQIAECDIDILKNEKGEDIKTILSIANYLIDTGLHTRILREYGLNEKVDITVDLDTCSITLSTQNDPVLEEEIMPTLSPVTEVIVKKPSPKRKRESDTPSASKRVKRLLNTKAFLAFKFDKNPLVGVRNYTLATFTEYVIEEPCTENWIEKLRGQLECLNVTHIVIQGRSQARYLKAHIPNIYFNVLPERNRETVCDECRTFSCSVGKVKHYMKYYHNFTLNISCK